MRISLVKCLKILLFSLLLSISMAALSQSSPIASTSEPDEATQTDQLTDEFDEPPIEESPLINTYTGADNLTLQHRLAQDEYIFREVIVLAIMAIISLTIVLTFMNKNGTCRPKDIVITAGLILIPFSTIILVLVADSQEQISAAIGVLGAIAGYLFGTASSQKSGGT